MSICCQLLHVREEETLPVYLPVMLSVVACQRRRDSSSISTCTVVSCCMSVEKRLFQYIYLYCCQLLHVRGEETLPVYLPVLLSVVACQWRRDSSSAWSCLGQTQSYWGPHSPGCWPTPAREEGLCKRYSA